jgi:hypothetical protein
LPAGVSEFIKLTGPADLHATYRILRHLEPLLRLNIASNRFG